MKIFEIVEKGLRIQATARLEKLIEINAPSLLVSTQKESLAGDCGLGKVGGIKKFGDLEFSEKEEIKFRRGVGLKFTLQDGSNILLIPGPYGLFLTDQKS